MAWRIRLSSSLRVSVASIQEVGTSFLRCSGQPRDSVQAGCLYIFSVRFRFPVPSVLGLRMVGLLISTPSSLQGANRILLTSHHFEPLFRFSALHFAVLTSREFLGLGPVILDFALYFTVLFASVFASFLAARGSGQAFSRVDFLSVLRPLMRNFGFRSAAVSSIFQVTVNDVVLHSGWWCNGLHF